MVGKCSRNIVVEINLTRLASVRFPILASAFWSKEKGGNFTTAPDQNEIT